MIYRPYEAEDEPKLRRIHAERGYTFEFPELDAPDIVSVWIAEDEGRIIASVVARRTVEVSALIDQEYSTPAWRLEVLNKLQEHGAEELKRKGFSDMHSFVKPYIRGFGRRLVRSLGWIRSQGGDCYVRGV